MASHLPNWGFFRNFIIYLLNTSVTFLKSDFQLVAVNTFASSAHFVNSMVTAFAAFF